MGWLNSVVILYALLNIGGGIAAYLEKHLMPSLIAGVLAGVILIGAAAMAKTNPKIGFAIAAIVAVADLAFFTTRYATTHTMWPAATMAIASVVVLICLVLGHFVWRRAH